MSVRNNYTMINIREYLALGTDEEVGEPALVRLLSDFSCPQNPDDEYFLKKNAIEFTKKNQSVTYLVFSNNEGELIGYFSIAMKPMTVRGETVSNTVKRKLLRISELDEKSQTYTMSAYLIAQLGKNFADGRNNRITGAEMLELAWSVIEEMQYMGGGMVVFLEANNDHNLLKYKNDNTLSQFDTRQTTSNDQEPPELVQLLRLL